MVAAASRSSPIVTPLASQCVTGVPSRTSTPQPLERRAAPRRSASRGKAGSTRGPASTSTMRASRGIDVAEVVAQRDAGELGDGAGHLHAGRAAADHDEGEEALRARPGVGPPRPARRRSGCGGGCRWRRRSSSGRAPRSPIRRGRNRRAARRSPAPDSRRRPSRSVERRRCGARGRRRSPCPAAPGRWPPCAGWRGSARRSAAGDRPAVATW